MTDFRCGLGRLVGLVRKLVRVCPVGYGLLSRYTPYIVLSYYTTGNRPQNFRGAPRPKNRDYNRDYRGFASIRADFDYFFLAQVIENLDYNVLVFERSFTITIVFEPLLVLELLHGGCFSSCS